MFELTGVEETIANLDAIEAALEGEGMRSALEQGAIIVLRRSDQLAPELKSELVLSGRIASNNITTTQVVVSIVYDARHSLIQHEGFFNPGPLTRAKPGAGRKFLSRALFEKRAEVLDTVGEDVGNLIVGAVRPVGS